MESQFFKRLKQVAYIKNKVQADLVNDVGKNSATINRWWNGSVIPGPRNMRLLADYFGCNQRWLETGEGEPFLTEVEAGCDIVLPMAPISQPKQGQEGMEGDLSVKELLADAQDVLESDTIYRQALAANIRAFKQAVMSEVKMKSTDEKIDQMMEQISTLTAMMMQSQINLDSEKKRAGNDH